MVDVIYAGRAGIEEGLEILSELIPIAKSQCLQYKATADRCFFRTRSTNRSGHSGAG